MNNETAENKFCKACGAAFSCGGETGKCWCFEVETEVEKLKILRGKFSDCLCENCLLKETNAGKSAH